jgi:hypothetical protein
MVARLRVAGPATMISAVSGTAANGGVSCSRNACVPSVNQRGSPAFATCQFPVPSLSHQEKPGSAVSPVRATSAYRSSGVKPVAFNLRLFLALLLVAAYAVAGATLLARGGGGLHWLPVAFIPAVSIAASNAWILLVEVLR